MGHLTSKPVGLKSASNKALWFTKIKAWKDSYNETNPGLILPWWKHAILILCNNLQISSGILVHNERCLWFQKCRGLRAFLIAAQWPLVPYLQHKGRQWDILPWLILPVFKMAVHYSSSAPLHQQFLLDWGFWCEKRCSCSTHSPNCL